MTTRLLMTADAVGGVWQYATELAKELVPHGVKATIVVLGPKPSEVQRRDLSPSPFRASGAPSLSRWERDEGGAAPNSLSRREREGACSPKASGKGEDDDAPPIEIIHTDLPLDWLTPGPEPVLAAGQVIADLARDLRADLVHLNSPTLAARTRFPAPVVAMAHGCTATWWRAAHGTAPDSAYAWQADLMRAGLLAADAVVAPSASFATDLQRTYALPTTPLAVHNGRTSPPSPQRGEGRGEGLSREQTVDSAPHALTAGRLWDRVKNTAVLDRAAARLSVPFRAAGPVTGPHGETVSPEHLRLLGNLPAADLAAELARRPVFVSATSFEPFGLAVLEAAQAGCALVLSNIPSFRELWDGAALFVPSQDDAAIADAIETLLADPTRRAALARAASERAARYTPEATAAAMASLYARLLSTRRAAA